MSQSVGKLESFSEHAAPASTQRGIAMTEEPEKVDLGSPDLAAQHRAALSDLFPGVLQDGVLDSAKLGELLGVEVSAPAGGLERYGLTWAGKADAIRSLQAPSTATLVPDFANSIDWDTAKNAFIEGDNLEVLKLMQKAYNDKVKLIYIDPPYNTGNDFIYPDDFRDGLRGYLDYTGQLDEKGLMTSTAVDTSGRRHSRWLNMLYPRLVLARNLLRQDGVIAISIDDSELANLLAMCSDVYGYSNVINVIPVKSSEASGVKMSHVERRLPKIKEYVVICARSADMVKLNPIAIQKGSGGDGDLDSYLKYYGKIIVDPSLPVDEWSIVPVKDFMAQLGLGTSPEEVRAYKIQNADRVVYRTNNSGIANMHFDTETAEVVSATGLRYIWWEGKQMLFLADYLNESLCDLWTDISTINLNKETLGVRGFRNGQKPLKLVDRLLSLVTTPHANDLVLDFFAGSGTTGHAVVARNASDGGNRRFVLVQLPEPLNPDVPEQRDGATFCDEIGRPRTISSMTVERVRRALHENSSQLGGGSGLKAVTLVSSSFHVSVGDTNDVSNLLVASTLVSDVPTMDALAQEVLLREGVPVGETWVKSVASGADVIVAGNVAVVLSLDVTKEVVEAALKLAPERGVLVFLEDGFAGRDAVKANAVTDSNKLGIKLKTV